MVEFIADKIIIFKENAKPKMHQILDHEFNLLKEWSGETNLKQRFWFKKRYLVTWEGHVFTVVDILTLEEEKIDIREIKRELSSKNTEILKEEEKS